MAGSMRDIKNRIHGTKKTSQITKAMNMVSASKLKRSERKTLDYQPFLTKIRSIVTDVVDSNRSEIQHKMLQEREIKKIGYILLTSDRGLAGGFNSNVCKKMNNDIRESNKEHKVLAFGTKGFAFTRGKKLNLVNEHILHVHDEIVFTDIIEPIREMISLYENGEVDEIKVYYNHYINTITQEVRSLRLLPITKEEVSTEKVNVTYDYEQDPQELINLLLPTYIENTLFGLLLNSKTSEHASRMTAMKKATDNAESVMKELQLLYNRARQAAITLELTDIVGGANAVK